MTSNVPVSNGICLLSQTLCESSRRRAILIDSQMCIEVRTVQLYNTQSYLYVTYTLNLLIYISFVAFFCQSIKKHKFILINFFKITENK
jgi:hypothetical protein